MVSVVILGTGNVAKHLFDAFQTSKKVKVSQVIGRNKSKLQYFENRTATTSNFKDVISSEVIIIAVRDDFIGEVSSYLKESDSLVVHTSGSVSISELKTKRKGVFYPLQTFTEGVKIDFKSIPICIEAENQTDLSLLEKLGKTISENVVPISSEQRRLLHLSAVFVNNFTNYIYQIGQEICETNNLSFDLLKPLIKETSNKINNISPTEAQTGPARRNDMGTIHTQLSLLKNKEHREVYKIMTNSIKASYGKKL